MTKDEYTRRCNSLMFASQREELICVCRQYEASCRREGDIDELASVLDNLSGQLSIAQREDEAREVINDLAALRKALTENDPARYGKEYAELLSRMAASWSNTVDEAIARQEEAIGIYRQLGLYTDDGFDIGFNDAFGLLGEMYCSKGDYSLGIGYLEKALQRSLKAGDNNFQTALYFQQLGNAHMNTGNLAVAQRCIEDAIDYFARAERADPDPCTFPHVIDECREMLGEILNSKP